MQLKGRLLLRDGSPAGGYVLWAQEETSWRVSFGQVTTGAEGEFLLTPQVNTWQAPLNEGDKVVLTFYVMRGGYVWAEILDRVVTWQQEGDVGIELSLAAPVDGTYFHAMGRVTDGVAPIVGATVRVKDKRGVAADQEAVTGPSGWYNVWFPFGDGTQPQLELDLVDAAGEDVPFYPPYVGFGSDYNAWVQLTLSYELKGTVIDRGTGKGVEQIRVEVWDAAGTTMLASASTDAEGAFAAALSRQQGPPPEKPTIRTYWLSQLLETSSPVVTWSAAGRAEGVHLAIGHEAAPLPIFTVKGTAIDRATRRGAPGLRAEAWAPDGSYMLAVADTDADGGFTLTLAPAADGTAPQARVRLYRDGQVVAQPDTALVWNGNVAEFFVEADLPAVVRQAARISGRLIEKTTHDALGGLRVEAWDRSPRDGGSLGVSAVTAPDGSFDIAFPIAAGTAPPSTRNDGQTPPIVAIPPPPVMRGLPGNGDVPLVRPIAASMLMTRPEIMTRIPMPTPPIVDIPRPDKPDLVFRIYDGDRLASVVVPEISWASEGVATTIVEVPAPTPPGASQEVGLHEIGESVASTVDRVQTELARYPNAMGAYLLDEIDLRLPVEMRVDELGQVRTKVVDAANASGPEVGQLHMRIRPVLGATQRVADVPDQPLTVLGELSASAIAKLEGQRIYSVENLARVAMTGAGRTALESLDLGVDLAALLDKAALLAFPELPRPVREALVERGLASLQEFARYADRPALAAALSSALAQEISADDVEAWQKSVAKALAVPRPATDLRPRPAVEVDA